MPVLPRAFKTGITRLWLLPIVMMLAACDDNWDIKPYYDVPYTYDRTAGHGVEWMRAHMLRQKPLKAEPLMKSETPHKNPVRVSTHK